MSKIPEPRFSAPPPDNRNLNEYLTRLHGELVRWGRDVREQINQLSEGRIQAHYNSLSATPSLNVILQNGDIIRANSVTEQGTTSAKYVVLGWIAIDEGTASAAAVLELRCLTGN